MSISTFIKLTVCLFVSFVSHTTAHKSAKNLSLIYSFDRFRVCGSYCGPGWCNNKWLDENKCDTSVEPEHHKLTGYSCADSCCKIHDKCCGHDKKLQQNCNKEIVNCLSKCDSFSATCTFDGVPTMAGEIELAMYIVEKWYCSSKWTKSL